MALNNTNVLEILRVNCDLRERAKKIQLDEGYGSVSSWHAKNIYHYLNSEKGTSHILEVVKGNVSPNGFFIQSGSEVFYFSGTFLRSRLVFLRFISTSGFELFLVQFLNGLVGSFSFSDSKACLFKRGDGYKAWVSAFLEVAYRDLDGFKKYLESEKVFYGLLLNTEVRPSHFFYEMLCPIVNKGVCDIVTSPSRHVYWKKTDFIDTSKILGGGSEMLVVDWGEFSAECIHENRVVFQPGFWVWGAYNKKSNFIDKALRDAAYPLSFYSDEGRPVIWLSVLSEEKAWVEQNDTYSKIISDVLEMGYEPVVIFDGITRTCSESYLPYSKKRKDVEDIQRKVGQYFEFIDIHGFTAEEKISFAMLSDIFIASMGTDSMYPSRIAGKPGVVHCSPDISMFGKHVYSEGTYKTNPASSNYLDGQDDLRPDKRSYSIKEGVVEGLFWSCWEKVKTKREVNDG
ncbi:hypothetical protein [Halomonas alkaliantarctica]|uniref:hypothetical protein n=1 Tax=Halomonas alkaliantarctica TaxID=232346 RepID=UPI000AFF8D96|nr:hypothetical protein [Halomonas alkaliantarctica]